MKTIQTNKKLLQFLGLTLFIQAMTSLIGGSIFLGPFDSNEITDQTLRTISESTAIAHISILLQIITAVVIILLGIAMYRAAGHRNKVLADIALSMYIFEAILLVVGQLFIFALLETAQLYIVNGDPSLISFGKVLLVCREFTGGIAMIPFGIGAFSFYYLLLSAEIIPKWLGLYGLITVPLIFICVPLMTFGISVPFLFLVPYVPFEFFTGIFVFVTYTNIPN